MKTEASKYAADSLGEIIAQVGYADLPDDVVRVGKQLLLDNIGCMLGGSSIRPGKGAINLARSMGGGNGTVMGSAESVAPVWAAYANAQLGNILDYDDTWQGLGHLGPAIVSSALATGEMNGSSGEEVLRAIVLGFEVAARVAEAIRPTPERIEKVWGQGTFIVFGSAIASALLLNQEPRQLAYTLGLAGIHAPVPAVRKIGYSARPLGWAKNNFGWAAMGGVVAALLVSKEGYRSNRSIFDGRRGFWIMSSSDRSDPGLLCAPLDDYRISDVAFKPYPCCRYIHTTIDACNEIMNEIGQEQPSSIEKIKVRGASKLLDYADYSPHGIIDLQFSIPFLIAMVVNRMPPGIEWLREENVTNADLAGIAGLVEFEQDDEADRQYDDLRFVTRVEMTLRDGRVVSSTKSSPRGDPDNPLASDELTSKFFSLSRQVIGDASSRELIDMVNEIESVENVGGLLRLCRNVDRSCFMEVAGPE